MHPSHGVAVRSVRNIDISGIIHERVSTATNHEEENQPPFLVDITSSSSSGGDCVALFDDRLRGDEESDDGNHQHDSECLTTSAWHVAPSKAPATTKGLRKRSVMSRKKNREEKPDRRGSRDLNEHVDNHTTEMQQEGKEHNDGENERRQAFQDLAMALSEAQRELRDAKDESDVLRQTCRALSDSLRQSESERLALQLELESLHLQLSSVCYVDLNQHRRHNTFSLKSSSSSSGSSSPAALSSPDRPRHLSRPTSQGSDAGGTNEIHCRPALQIGNDTRLEGRHFGVDTTPKPSVLARRKKSRRVRAGQQPQLPSHSRFSDDGEDSVVSLRSIKAGGEHLSREIDGNAPDVMLLVEDVDVTVAPRSSSHGALARASDGLVPARAPSATDAASPSQAAFYRVLAERDHVRQDAERLRKEVKAWREQVRTLRSQLLKSTALIELSYQRGGGDEFDNDRDADGSDDDTDQEDVEGDESVPGVKRLPTARATATSTARSSPLRKIKWLRRSSRRRLRQAKLLLPPLPFSKEIAPPRSDASDVQVEAGAPSLQDHKSWDSHIPPLQPKEMVFPDLALAEAARCDDSTKIERSAMARNLTTQCVSAVLEEDRCYVDQFQDPNRDDVQSLLHPSSSTTAAPSSDADEAAGGTRHGPLSPNLSRQNPSSIAPLLEKNRLRLSSLLTDSLDRSSSPDGDEDPLQEMVRRVEGKLVEL